MSVKKSFIIFGIFMMILTGCSEGKKNTDVRVKPTDDAQGDKMVEYCDDVVISDDEKIIYNIYAQKLGVYNGKNNSWKSIHKNDNEFAYKTKGENDMFTVGNSNYNYFVVMQRDKDGLHKKVEIDKRDSAMPIGEYEGEYYFLYNVDDLSEKIERKIVKWNQEDNQFVDVLNLENQLVASGVIVKDKIYYAAYQTKLDSYRLYEYDIQDKSNKMVREDLPTDYLYNLDKSLIWNDGKGNIHNFKGEMYSLGEQESEIDYNSEHSLFFQIYANKSKVLICDVWDAKTGEKKKTVEQFIGYDIEEDELLLYCNYGVDKISLK